MKAIIFDFDNTLIKSNIDFPTLKITMGRMVKEHGLDFGPEKEIPLKYTAGDIIEKASTYDKKIGTTLTKELWRLVEEFERKGMENLEIENGVLDLLEFLKERNIKSCLLTNNSKRPTLEVLKEYKMMDYFSPIVAREDVRRMKPDKEGIDFILSKEQLNKDEVAFVGDSWVDGKAAQNAGIRFILYREDPLDEKEFGITIWKHVTTMKELKVYIQEELSSS